MSMTMVEIEKQLKTLNLNGMLTTLESRALQANQGNTVFVEALSWLLQDERGNGCQILNIEYDHINQ